MTPTYELILGNSLDALAMMPAESVDSIVTDPPYELAFMGKDWDASGIAFDPRIWRACLRVLKPGGHLLAFSGSRTYHRMACAIEDAGFELRDQIMWLYGSGFPKSLNVAKAIESGGGRPEDIRRMAMGEDYAPSGRGRANYDHGAASAMNGTAGDWEPATDAACQWQGWGTALKPAHEPICVARKPLVGTVAANVLTHGTGALNIDACRVEFQGDADQASAKPQGRTTSKNTSSGNGAAAPDAGRECDRVEFESVQGSGRWPANVIHDGSDEVLAAFPDAPGQIARAKNDGQASGNQVFGALRNVTARPEARIELDQSAARFFYCAKASRADRNDGVGGSDAPAVETNATMRDREDADWPARNGNHHPTVKPTELMAYLCRLVMPPGGVMLDPFMGSGSTGKAAMREGIAFIGVELRPDYFEIAHARIAHEYACIRAAEEQASREREESSRQIDLFAGMP
ncbi:site-specific DNA-methyltransferase [Burkholderia arboris]|uniref:DNA-methyltransferase n=1 Tax=Burkholderia arboris TaxID=488730 RepID=UPI001CF5C75F|nr:DNA methyltransferase [Burkholderia arboris]MCA8037089.1 site-specific DNA-methyltransferase [Burkholderia arboris]